MKKVLKFTFFLFLVLLILFLIMDKPLPIGEEGPRAKILADKIQKAINKDAWDSTNFIQWTFIGRHHYLWDRKRHLVEVKWGNYAVLLNPNTLKGKVYINNIEQKNDAITLNKAYRSFTNDAFWLNAFTQIYNGNTVLKFVEMEGASSGLLVTYLNGGVTPGDSYLWIVDENGLPSSWQMWVSVFPLGGIELTWEDWIALPNGAMVAQSHKAGPFNVKISNLKIFQSWEDGGYSKDPFFEIIDF